MNQSITGNMASPPSNQGNPQGPLKKGDAAPDFILAQRSGPPVSLQDFRGQPVILAFYPAAWDPARAGQLALYNRVLSQLPGQQAKLLSISMDGIWCQLNFSEEQVQFPLLSDLDSDGETARLFGVSGQQALFVVDGDGIIRWSHGSPVGVHPRVEDVLSAVKALSPDEPARNGRRANHAAAARDIGKAPGGVTRREFLVTAVAAAFTLAVFPHVPASAQPSPTIQPVESAAVTGVDVILSVNGKDYPVNVEPRVTLLDALRERLGLTGSKKGCDHGQCGACTVLVDGRRINSCLTLAVMHQGQQITTIEGLAQGEQLHPMQAAFLEHDGFQCGYCTPGQIMSAVGLVAEGHARTDAEIRELMSGNICRCGAYPNIVAAVREVVEGKTNASV